MCVIIVIIENLKTYYWRNLHLSDLVLTGLVHDIYDRQEDTDCKLRHWVWSHVHTYLAVYGSICKREWPCTDRLGFCVWNCCTTAVHVTSLLLHTSRSVLHTVFMSSVASITLWLHTRLLAPLWDDHLDPAGLVVVFPLVVCLVCHNHPPGPWALLSTPYRHKQAVPKAHATYGWKCLRQIKALPQRRNMLVKS